MPVEKLDGAVLRKLDTGYDVVCRASIETLKTGEALALFVVMATRPQNWIFNKDWLMSRTGFGKDRYKRGMDELKSAGFVTVATVRTDGGGFSGRVIWFSQLPTEVPENGTSRFPELPENGTLKEERESLKKKETAQLGSTSDELRSKRFAEFYENYPRRVARADAERAWKKLSDRDRDLAIADVKKRAWSKDKKFIPYPASYLNGQRWLDEERQQQAMNSYGAGAI